MLEIFFKIGEFSPMVTESEVSNCLSIIFRCECQGLQNNRQKHKNTDAIVCVHTRSCSCSFNNKLTCTSIIEFSGKTN